MEAINIDSIKTINKKNFINSYGLRSYTLWILSKYSQELGFEVPNSFLINSDLSIELLRYFYCLNIQPDGSNNYLKPDASIIYCYYNYLKEKKDLIDIAISIDGGVAPIIRGTSCAEGYNNLSFAGVCHSYIPSDNLLFEENIFIGFAKVLSSIHSPYSQYYFNSHNIPEIGKNIGIIMMKMLKKPLFHVTAYVYPTEIRIKYFFTPITGTLYKGGGDIILDYKNEDYILDLEFGKYGKIWKHTINVLRKLSLIVYKDSSPIDVEFLINENKDLLSLNIVQIRRLSDVHLKNYERSKTLLGKTDIHHLVSDIVINKSYLYHSVINCLAEVNVSETYFDNHMNEFIRVFIVSHQYGVGLFSFLNSLPKTMTKKIGLIVSHPSERSHDHLQYSVYEDDRIEFVVHVNGELTSNLKDGMIVHMISDGNKVTIKEKDKFRIDNVNINFINSNQLPESSNITAVFLVGFVDDKIITIRNERGWDIPGGHVESVDLNLKDALVREIDEEAGAIIQEAEPYAIVQFEGREKAMLFYVSNNCTLGDFIPKRDSFERELMTTSDFLDKYNWKKDVIELLIKRALLVLKNKR